MYSHTRIGRPWRTMTTPTRMTSRQRKARPTARSTTTKSCSADSRSRWCWPRTGRPRASPPRWCGLNTGRRLKARTCSRDAAVQVEPTWADTPLINRAATPSCPLRRAAKVRHGAEYYVPRPNTTTRWNCLPRRWRVGMTTRKLTVYDKAQGVQNVQRYLCTHIRSEARRPAGYVPLFHPGGAFGSGPRPQYQVVLAVLAARALERSARVVLTQEQNYGARLSAGDDPADRG